jgi:gliding motility-associated-like protein
MLYFYNMRSNKLILLILLTAYVTISNAQITTSTMTPAQYVQNVLLGPGVTASNITYTGLPKMIASYTAAPAGALGINKGVYLTTGTNGIIPADVGPTGPSFNMQSEDNLQPGDTYLDAFSNGLGTNDASVLEFDFVPQSDTVRFKYVFGSEEYNFYVGSSFNDVFAFVLTGVSTPFPSTNIALIPGTTTRISINNVNNGQSSGLSSGPCTNCSYFRDNDAGNIDCVYNGLTTVLTAKSHVICGQTYHIKLAIADVADGSLDSGVFLEAGSFSSPVPIALGAENSNPNLTNTQQLIEDCNTNCIYFIRNGNISLADSFSLQVGGSAVLGIDYIQTSDPLFSWPTKIKFIPNQDTVRICNIFALQDNLAEPIEAITFTLTGFNNGTSACLVPPSATYSLSVKDYTPIVIGQGDSSFCNNHVPLLIAHVSGGVPGYGYSWMPGNGGGSTYTASGLTQTTIFTLTVNDACNMTQVKTFSVNVTPTVSVSSASICAGETAVLTATGAATYIWSTGATTNPISVSPASPTNYTVTGFIGPCTNSAVVTVNIITTPTVVVSGNNSICEGQSTTLTASGATSYLWSTSASGPSITVNPSSTTNYQVVGGAGTCTNAANYQVNVTAVPNMTVSGSVICAGQQASVTATGASTYQWNTGETTSTIHPSPSGNTSYSVTGANGNCTNTAVYTQSVTTDTPQLQAVGPYKFCTDTVKQIPAIVTSNNPNYFLTWTAPNGGQVPYDTVGYIYYFSSSQPTAGIYTITVTDLCNNKHSVTVDITVTTCDIQVPNVVTSNGDNVNDAFKIRGLESFSNTVLSVYNRWGKRVYNNENYTNDWKPDVNAGTYFYVLNLADGRKYNGFFEVFN